MNDGLQAQLRLLRQDNGRAELDEETKAVVAKAYRTKMEALKLLHYQHGHLTRDTFLYQTRLGDDWQRTYLRGSTQCRFKVTIIKWLSLTLKPNMFGIII